MNTIEKTVGSLSAALAVSASGVAQAQVTISKDKGGEASTFLAGKLSVARDIASVENTAFMCALEPFKKGDTLVAMVSEGQAWSLHKQTLEVGKQKMECSVMAVAKSRDGESHTFFPAWLEFKMDVKVGKTAHANGFQIETTRPIKAGSRIPVILVGLSSMLSIESEEGAKNANTTSLPWVIVHKEDLDANGRSASIDIWRIAKEHCGK